MAYNPEQPVFETEVKSSIKLLYGVEDRPKTWWETLFYAWQVTLVDFTPFIWAGAFVSLAGLPDTVIPTMISACFLAMGIGTIIQTTIGNRLPIVQGPSSSVLTAMGGVTAIYGFPAMWGAVLVGGLLEMIIGASRILGKIRNFIPPVVTGSVVTAIGFVAAKISITWIFSSTKPLHLLLALIAFLLALILKYKGKGVWSQGFILISVVAVGVVLSTILGQYDWAKVAAAPWFAFPRLFPFKGFDGTSNAFVLIPIAIIGGFTGYIGSMFESLGDYAATCAVSGETYRVKHINKGIAAEGLGCIASGFLGALPVTSYTQNIGIIAATGIASRFITQVAAVMFLFYGLSPKLAMALACIPRSVVGGVFAISASLIMFSGLEVIFSETQSFENNLIAGTTIGAAVMVPFFASTTGAKWVSTMSSFPKMYMNNNVFIAVTVGIVMNLLVNYVLKPKDGQPLKE
ncbi:uracil-xanthine permease family protein [Lutispora saccharofermentans]|uniref:Xanthine permease n=2 Tax=root TaxID=1 RepID=A0ABT1NAC0_9FIRM|nr:solute carrier family 23 protein [Lutispora saccharofermentans]MCQ1528200.1 xanthine permease [Lutispora saccharofermentans]